MKIEIITHRPDLNKPITAHDLLKNQKSEIIETTASIPLQDPGILELASNFSKAIEKWVSAGFPISEESIYKKRSSICEVCEYWHGEARFGLGVCKAKGCGCTRLKRWLETEKCPKGKW